MEQYYVTVILCIGDTLQMDSTGRWMVDAWASAHRGKWGQLTPLEKWMEN